MHFRIGVLAASAVALLVASCAPAPEPLAPEPVFDKYGTAIVYECRPSTIPVGPNYPDRLPICEEQCRPGTQPNPNASASPTLPQCIPIPDDRDDGNQQPRSPNTFP